MDKNRFRLLWYLLLFTAVSTVWTALGIWLILAGVSLFLPAVAATWLFEPWFGILTGAVLSLLYIWLTLARSERWLVQRLDAIVVPKGESLDSKMVLKDMAIASGMRVAPAFYFVPSDNTNAFVFDAIGRRPILGVTKGLIERLSLDEQRAVFANLVARVVSGDVMVASATTALLAPLQAWRDRRMQRLDDEMEFLQAAAEQRRNRCDSEYVRTSRPIGPDVLLMVFPLLPFGLALIFLGELLAYAARSSQLTAAEKADAEGMLLLKDPQAMISAIETCVGLDNVVPMAGEALGELFYCWTGDSTDDEDDPEWTRVARLREVLGVEGHVPADGPLPDGALPPQAPRIGRA